MPTIREIYKQIITHIDDPEDLKDLSDMLKGEAIRRIEGNAEKSEGATAPQVSLNPETFWPFPTVKKK